MFHCPSLSLSIHDDVSSVLVYSVIESTIDVKKPHKVLIVGIGKSNVIDVLYDKGFRDITAIDISPVIIALMQEKYRKYSGVDCMSLCSPLILILTPLESILWTSENFVSFKKKLFQSSSTRVSSLPSPPLLPFLCKPMVWGHHRMFGLYLLWIRSLWIIDEILFGEHRPLVESTDLSKEIYRVLQEEGTCFIASRKVFSSFMT